MGATASAINSLSSTTVIDIYKRFVKKGAADSHYLKVSRISTFCWGIFTIGIALYSSQLGNLLEAVNILGSLFYGTILGIFLVAFYVKSIGGKAVFWSAVITEVIVIGIWRMDIVAFLWLNLIGCALLILIGFILQYFLGKNNTQIKTV
jgi:Na+/proline symporter